MKNGITDSCILGIDYGTKFIGLALARSGKAMPLDTLIYKKDHQLEKDALKKITDIVLEESCRLVVVGLPLIKGEETSMSQEVRRFSNLLKAGLPDDVKIEYVDESRSSKDAAPYLVASGVSKKRRKDDHAYSAVEILNRYMVDK